MIARDARTVADVDEFRAGIRPAGAEVIVTARGRFAAHITRTDFKRLWMERAEESLPRLIHASINSKRGCFSFLTHPGPGIVLNGIESRPGDIAALSPGRDFSHRISGAPKWGGMSLPVEDLAEIGVALAGRDVSPPPDAPPITPSPAAMAKLLRLHAVAGYLGKNTPDIIANPNSAHGLEQALIEALVACIAAPNLQNDRLGRHRHHTIMRKFYALLEERTGEAAYVAELCVAMGVSHRTLRMCCQEHLGTGPKQFLLRRRMHLAHRALRASDMATTTVTDIATQYGFWEFGRFAVAYKSMFGESPSVTLRYPRP